jgi:hypothetical protein
VITVHAGYLQLNKVEELLQAHSDELTEELEQLIIADRENKKMIIKIK